MSFWHGKRVLVTGHTGFKGSWLCLWLESLGARVSGLALEPDTNPALFHQLSLAHRLDHRIVDLRDREKVAEVVADVRPEIVFHLAAQPLVLRAYREPVETWAVNVLGTVHVLDALRSLEAPCAVVAVTSDKVYENREWDFGYRESDALGGHDPYSASKAAAEIAISCWRRSFYAHSPLRVASVRAGNVIGGGDWSENRIVPDLARALASGRPMEVRNPDAVRPWQHVLEPLGGYMRLAQRMCEDPAGSRAGSLADAFNFGPTGDACRPVRALVEEALTRWPGEWRATPHQPAHHEAGRLALSIDLAREQLGWAPKWSFARSVHETVDWYRAILAGADAREFTLAQISAYAHET